MHPFIPFYFHIYVYTESLNFTLKCKIYKFSFGIARKNYVKEQPELINVFIFITIVYCLFISFKQNTNKFLSLWNTIWKSLF